MARLLCMAMCAYLLLGVVVHCGTQEELAIICSTVCHHVRQYDPTMVQACGCPVHGFHKGHPTMEPVHTDDVCKYLCSIQMGGAACDCSIAIVPGKK